MKKLESTAEIVGPPSEYIFGGKKIIIQNEKGVAGSGNYYTDIGMKYLYDVVSDPTYSELFEAAIGRGTYSVAVLSLTHYKSGLGIDVNPKAVALTKRNLKSNGISKPCKLEVASVFEYM